MKKVLISIFLVILIFFSFTNNVQANFFTDDKEDNKSEIEETIDKTVIETVHIKRERGGLMNASSFCYQFRIFSLIRSRWERKIFGGEDNM